MQAYAEGFELFQQSEFELDNAKIAHLWNQGSVIRSWLCELAARAFEADGNDLAGSRAGSRTPARGAGRSQDAIDHGVPTPALSAALNSRFYSREPGDYSARVLAALRNQFGGPRRQAERRRDADRRSGPNPLAQGLERLPVAPTNLVIFGATGDLARRKLLPAIYNLAHEGALPERFNLIGVSRGELTHEAYREIAAESIRRVLAHAARRDRAERPARRSCATSPERFDDADAYATLSHRARGARRRRRRADVARLLPVDGARVLLGDRRARSARRASRTHEDARRAGDHREAVRDLAGGGARAQRRGAFGVRRAPGLPDRPLPRQGDRAEHARVPLRQRHVRAALEPQLHRQRADHRGRGHRDRQPRRLLRPRRRAARPRRRTTCCSC